MGADKDESWGIALGNPHFFLQEKVWFDGKKSDTRIQIQIQIQNCKR